MRKKENWFQRVIRVIKRRIRTIRSRMASKRSFRKYRSPRPLDEKEILWVFAAKDGRVTEHYKEFYGTYEDAFNEKGEVHNHILVSIWSSIIDHMEDGWAMVFRNIRAHDTIFYRRYFNKDRKEDYSLRNAWDEILVHGIRCTFMFLETRWLNDKHNAIKNWKDISEKYRNNYYFEKEKVYIENDVKLCMEMIEKFNQMGPVAFDAKYELVIGNHDKREIKDIHE